MPIVLVTEDEPVIREFARLAAEDAGFHVLCASDVDEALGKLRSEQPIDVLFVDINLRPLALGGLELARIAVKMRPELRVIYTTGHHMSDEKRLMMVPGSLFISKPYVVNDITEALAKSVSGSG
jgi:two-component system, response regulator PdtaR